jgi:FKBP-type peptidyl-prolyl cis-trans isomerase
LNGKKFDSSFDRGQPFEFTLGKGEVIAGWDEGVAMMNVGGTATFVIPSVLRLRFKWRSGDIPPFAPLVFEVQLLKAL